MLAQSELDLIERAAALTSQYGMEQVAFVVVVAVLIAILLWVVRPVIRQNTDTQRDLARTLAEHTAATVEVRDSLRALRDELAGLRGRVGDLAQDHDLVLSLLQTLKADVRRLLELTGQLAARLRREAEREGAHDAPSAFDDLNALD